MNPLRPIEDILTAGLEWLHSSVGLPWAWAIIGLTIIVRMVILPLTIKQVRSMQRLQVHAPELKAIQQKYKNDRPRQNEEVMKFYRENKVNPAASCLPILLQLPIFFALFFVLRDFESEVFPDYPESDLGWLNLVPSITDAITSHWSGYVLLVVYVASQLASIVSTPMTDPRQRYIFYSMPFLFVVFILAFPTGNFPLGLMLYWVTTNLWTVGQGIVMRRLVPKPEPPSKRTSRTPPREERAAAEATATGGDARPAAPAQQRVRRRKKKGPRARR